MEEVVDDSAVVAGEEYPIEETTVRPRGGESSDSDSERRHEAPTVEALRSKVYRIFGRERPVHEVLGGGKPADLILWRNKKVSAVVLGGATLIWVLFELIEYHLLQLVCHCLIFGLAIVFLWSNAISLMHKSPPKVPEVHIPEDLAVNVALVLKTEINWALAVLRDIASGRDLKKFLVAITGLWVLSIFGNCCNFLTLFYIVVILLHTVPVLYEKYDDKVDSLAEKAMAEFRKQYEVVDAKFLSKIPRGPLKDKRQ